MNRTRFWLGALAYLAITFPVAALWHLALFADQYEALGYFGRDEPILAMGFLAIAMQGLFLSALYPRLAGGRGPVRDGLVFGLGAGFFLWTSQVLAQAAKSHVEPISTYLLIETVYFAIQFALVGIALGFIHAPASQTSDRSTRAALDVDV